jgi:hypothetical protein
LRERERGCFGRLRLFLRKEVIGKGICLSIAFNPLYRYYNDTDRGLHSLEGLGRDKPQRERERGVEGTIVVDKEK